MSVRLMLVADNDQIVYDDPDTDPFPLADKNGETQAAIDMDIGDANYDIGHLFHLAGNSISGNAGCIGCVCTTGSKGSAWSQGPNPTNGNFIFLVAHEMGHHVQRVTGTAAEVDRLASANPGDANDLSVRQELQADCYAGVWAATVYAEGNLESGDLDEAFTAAEAVGDDRLQKQAAGSVNPDSFTHGTSEQRRRWFEAGYESGEPARCDTFSADSL